MYVGQSVNLEMRRKNHFSLIKNASHICKQINADCKKHGFNTFTFTILEELPNTCNANTRLMCEKKWVEFYGGVLSDNLYNKITPKEKPLKNDDSCMDIHIRIKKEYQALVKKWLDEQKKKDNRSPSNAFETLVLNEIKKETNSN